MKNSFKLLFVVVPMFLAGSMYGHTLTVLNLTGMTTNLSAGSAIFVPAGRTEIYLSPGCLSEFGLTDGFDYQWIYDRSSSVVTSSVVAADSSIQDAFNQGLFWAAGIVAVLLSFSIIRTIPGGGQEEL